VGTISKTYSDKFEGVIPLILKDDMSLVWRIRREKHELHDEIVASWFLQLDFDTLDKLRTIVVVAGAFFFYKESYIIP